MVMIFSGQSVLDLRINLQYVEETTYLNLFRAKILNLLFQVEDI